MIKHYEHLWEEAEEVADKFYAEESPLQDIGFAATELISDENLTSEEREEKLGTIIFGLCALSKKFDLNAYTALRNAIDNAKIELFDENINPE